VRVCDHETRGTKTSRGNFPRNVKFWRLGEGCSHHAGECHCNVCHAHPALLACSSAHILWNRFHSFGVQKKVINPASNESNGLKEKLGLHGGFAKSLLESGNVQKILSEVKPILEENPDFKLFITGHSLGGALATLFGFYVAANDDPIYSKNGPIQIFSASSPRVGNKAFRDSFKYLEERGKLRHARIYNARDKVPLLPYVGGFYKHVGIAIKLRFRDLPIALDYPRYEGWIQSTRVPFWEQVTSTLEAVKFHGCGLIRNRLLAAKNELATTTLELEYKRMWGLSD